MQELIDHIIKIFKVEDKILFYELFRNLNIHHPQINHSTEIQKVDYSNHIEVPKTAIPKFVPPNLSKKAGIVGRLARIAGEIIPIKKIESAGYEVIISQLAEEIRGTPFNDFYTEVRNTAMQIVYLYLPEKDILFINSIQTYEI